MLKQTDAQTFAPTKLSISPAPEGLSPNSPALQGRVRSGSTIWKHDLEARSGCAIWPNDLAARSGRTIWLNDLAERSGLVRSGRTIWPGTIWPNDLAWYYLAERSGRTIWPRYLAELLALLKL